MDVHTPGIKRFKSEGHSEGSSRPGFPTLSGQAEEKEE